MALNRRACHLNLSNPGFVFSIDDDIAFEVRYTYQDSIGKRKENNLTKEKNDFTISDEFEGVIITTSSADDFLALSNQIGHKSFIEGEIKNLFVEKLKVASSGSELKFLYENIPDFVIKTLSNELKEDLLWKHFILLTEYDDKGMLSGWRDGSSALINVLKAFGKSKILLKKFKDDPKIVKRVYDNLDGFSVYENVLVRNRILFANLLMALCIDNQLKGLKITSKKFYYGDDYKFQTHSPNESDNESVDQFYIKQIRLIPLFGADILYPLTTEIDEDDGFMYNPLDIVFFEDTSTKDAIAYPVPAIFVRALGDEEKRQETETNIRIGFDILAIVIGSFVAVTTANPVVFALAVADIGLAVIDGGLQAYKTEILKFEGGKEFIDTWEKVYLFGGIALASPVLINIILNAGPRLLKIALAVKNFNAANFLKTCLLKVLLEIEIANFTRNTVKEIIYGEEALRSSGISFSFAGITRLQEQGVLFIKGIGFDDKVAGYAVVYKGEAIASGTAKEVREALKELCTSRGVKLIKTLNELPIIRFYKGITYTIVKTENEIKWIIKNSKLNNRARLFDGMLEFDLDTLGVTKNLGQRFTSEAFEFFNKNIKSVKAEWRTNPKYPEGSSLGYKEFTKALIKFNGDKIKAVKETTFYKTMSLYEFNKVDDVLDFSEKGGNIIILLKK